MGKMLLRLAVGIALAAMAFVLFYPTPDIAPPEIAGSEVLRPDAGAPEMIVESAAPFNGNADQAAAESEPEELAVPGDSPSLEELEARVEEAQGALALAEDELERAREVARWGNVQPQPIPLPPEFDWLSERPSEEHERVKREPVDPLWSATTEAQLNSYFLENPEIVQQFGHPVSVHCRTTRCEVAFVAYRVDEAAVARAEAAANGLPPEFFTRLRFRAASGDLPWAVPFRNDVEVNVEDGVTTILWHLLKNEQQTRVARSTTARR